MVQIYKRESRKSGQTHLNYFSEQLIKYSLLLRGSRWSPKGFGSFFYKNT